MCGDAMVDAAVASRRADDVALVEWRLLQDAARTSWRDARAGMRDWRSLSLLRTWRLRAAEARTARVRLSLATAGGSVRAHLSVLPPSRTRSVRDPWLYTHHAVVGAALGVEAEEAHLGVREIGIWHGSNEWGEPGPGLVGRLATAGSKWAWGGGRQGLEEMRREAVHAGREEDVRGGWQFDRIVAVRRAAAAPGSIEVQLRWRGPHPPSWVPIGFLRRAEDRKVARLMDSKARPPAMARAGARGRDDGPPVDDGNRRKTPRLAGAVAGAGLPASGTPRRSRKRRGGEAAGAGGEAADEGGEAAGGRRRASRLAGRAPGAGLE